MVAYVYLYFAKLAEAEKNRKLNDLLDALEFNQVVIFSLKLPGRISMKMNWGELFLSWPYFSAIILTFREISTCNVPFSTVCSRYHPLALELVQVSYS
jgi:hypothetical protein